MALSAAQPTHAWPPQVMAWSVVRMDTSVVGKRTWDPVEVARGVSGGRRPRAWGCAAAGWDGCDDDCDCDCDSGWGVVTFRGRIPPVQSREPGAANALALAPIVVVSLLLDVLERSKFTALLGRRA